jgi:O-antigen/teichoic acid export membrane protein
LRLQKIRTFFLLKLREIFRQLTISVIFRISAFLCTIYWIQFVNRNSSIGILGTYYYGLSIISYLSTVADLGYTATAKRLFPSIIGGKEEGTIKVAYFFILKRTIFVSITLSILCFLLVYLFHFDQKELAIIGITIPFQVWTVLNQNILRIYEKSIISEFFRLFHTPFFILIFTLIMWDPASAPVILYSSLILTNILSAIASFFIVKKYFIKSDDRFDIENRIKNLSKDFYKISLMRALTENIPTLALGYFTNTTLVGQYSVAKKVMQLTSFAHMSLSVYLSPLISKYNYNRMFSALREKIREVSIAVIIINTPLLIAIIIFASDILLVLGVQSATTILLLRILAIGQFMLLFFGYNHQLLSMTGHQKILVQVFAIHLFFKLLLIISIVTPYGYIGMEITIIGLELFLQGVLLVACTKKLGFSSFSWRTSQ